MSGASAVIDDPDVEVVVVATPHDTHEELVVQALTAGRHVWCEKPLALTAAGLDAVESAWRSSGCQLMVGFNRRWSPAVQAAQKVLAGVASPKLIVYRIAAGRVPDEHWYRDRRQGGRLLGEVCHFVDTAQALIGAEIEEATGLAGRRRTGTSRAGDDVVVSLRFADGSLAAIGYGSAAPTAGKELIEIVAGSHRRGHRRLPLRRGGRARRCGRAARTRAIARRRPPSSMRCGRRRQRRLMSMLATMRATIRASEVALPS